MNMNQLFQDLQAKLNSLAGKGGDGQSLRLKDQLDSLLGQVDRKLAGLIIFSLIAVMLGFGNLMRQWSLQGEHSELSEKIQATQQLNEELSQKLTNLNTKYRPAIEQAKLAPKTSSELLKLISEGIQRSGMSLTKVASAGAQSPDMFTVEAEGGYGGIRMVLSELRLYSASMDVRSLSVLMEPTRKTLVLSTTFKFVTPPKMAAADSVGQHSYAYMDGSHTGDLSFNKQLIIRSQFVPQGDSVPKSQGSPAAPVANDPAGPDRNPFYAPAGSNSSSGSYSGSPAGSTSVVGMGRSGPVRTNDGIYLTGCLTSKRKSACIFQLSDGSSSIVKTGGQIVKNITLVGISLDSVVIRSAGKESKIKVGEQIK